MMEFMQPPSATFNYFAFTISVLKSIWPLLLIGLAVKGIPLVMEILQRRRLTESGIFEIDKMDGKSFEMCLSGLFSRQGYRVEETPYTGDWGADLIVTKSGVRTVVQAKRYTKKVGVRAVQEAVAAKAKYHCAEAMVVTNSTFTKQAIELARVNGVSLWGREELVARLLKNKETQEDGETRQAA